MDTGRTTPPRTTRDGQVVHRRIIDHLPARSAYQRFNKAVALLVTRAIGTMSCAYLFAAFDCLALPTALRQGLYGIVQWTASFFLQLVLLSVIMVGQVLQGTASDVRSAKTFDDAEAILAALAVLEGKINALAVAPPAPPRLPQTWATGSMNPPPPAPVSRETSERLRQPGEQL